MLFNKTKFFRVNLENYYAVYYDDQYYIGRAVENMDHHIKFKFLSRNLDQYYWPRRDDIEIVAIEFVLLKIDLEGNGPFKIPQQQLNKLKLLYKSMKNYE